MRLFATEMKFCESMEPYLSFLIKTVEIGSVVPANELSNEKVSVLYIYTCNINCTGREQRTECVSFHSERQISQEFLPSMPFPADGSFC